MSMDEWERQEAERYPWERARDDDEARDRWTWLDENDEPIDDDMIEDADPWPDSAA